MTAAMTHPRKIVRAALVTAVLAGAVVPLATLPQQQQQQQQQNIMPKKSCNPDACIKMIRQKGYPFGAAAAWCAKNNNGC